MQMSAGAQRLEEHAKQGDRMNEWLRRMSRLGIPIETLSSCNPDKDRHTANVLKLGIPYIEIEFTSPVGAYRGAGLPIIVYIFSSLDVIHLERLLLDFTHKDGFHWVTPYLGHSILEKCWQIMPTWPQKIIYPNCIGFFDRIKTMLTEKFALAEDSIQIEVELEQTLGLIFKPVMVLATTGDDRLHSREGKTGCPGCKKMVEVYMFDDTLGYISEDHVGSDNESRCDWSGRIIFGPYVE